MGVNGGGGGVPFRTNIVIPSKLRTGGGGWRNLLMLSSMT